jgi:hypothetical protein
LYENRGAEGSVVGTVEVSVEGTWRGVSEPPERPVPTWLNVVPWPQEKGCPVKLEGGDAGDRQQEDGH